MHMEDDVLEAQESRAEAQDRRRSAAYAAAIALLFRRVFETAGPDGPRLADAALIVAAVRSGQVVLADDVRVLDDEHRRKVQERLVLDSLVLAWLLHRERPTLRRDVLLPRVMARLEAVPRTTSALAASTASIAQTAAIASAARGDDLRAFRSSIAKAEALAASRASLAANLEASFERSMAAEALATETGWKREIVERIDRRNHPFSRAANGLVAEAGERFEVPVGDVLAAARAMGRSPNLGAVIWPQQGSVFRGMHYPAHYGERGRILALPVPRRGR